MSETEIVENRKRIEAVEKTQVVMSNDIGYIKNRIDEGVSKTVTEIWKKLNGISDALHSVKPKIDEHDFWISQIKWAVIWIAVIAVGGSIVALGFFLVRKGLS